MSSDRLVPSPVVAAPIVSVQVAPYLRSALKQAAHNDGRTFTPEVWAWVDDLEAVLAIYRRVVSGVGGGGNEGLEPVRVESMPEMTCSEAAGRLGVTSEAVRRKCIRGTLPARQDASGKWLVRAESVLVAKELNVTAETETEWQPTRTVALGILVHIVGYQRSLQARLNAIDSLLGTLNEGQRFDLYEQLGPWWLEKYINGHEVLAATKEISQ